MISAIFPVLVEHVVASLSALGAPLVTCGTVPGTRTLSLETATLRSRGAMAGNSSWAAVDAASWARLWIALLHVHWQRSQQVWVG